MNTNTHDGTAEGRSWGDKSTREKVQSVFMAVLCIGVVIGAFVYTAHILSQLGDDNYSGDQATTEEIQAARQENYEQLQLKLAALGFPTEGWRIDHFFDGITGPVADCELDGKFIDGELRFYPRSTEGGTIWSAPLVNPTYDKLIERLPSMGYGYCVAPPGTS